MSDGNKSDHEIFIVDDDPAVRDALSVVLTLENYHVTSFADGGTFLTAARTRTPSCIILDVHMPGRSGLDILKELRARQYWTPIFLITARDEIQMVIEAMKNGAYDYIRKPFDQRAPGLRVRDAIEVWANRDHATSTLDVQPDASSEWMRVTPSEREAIALMRLMDVVRN